jgi:hypothetical protein
MKFAGRRAEEATACCFRRRAGGWSITRFAGHREFFWRCGERKPKSQHRRRKSSKAHLSPPPVEIDFARCVLRQQLHDELSGCRLECARSGVVVMLATMAIGLAVLARQGIDALHSPDSEGHPTGSLSALDPPSPDKYGIYWSDQNEDQWVTGMKVRQWPSAIDRNLDSDELTERFGKHIRAAHYSVYKEGGEIGVFGWAFDSPDTAKEAHEVLAKRVGDRFRWWRHEQYLIGLWRDTGTSDKCLQHFEAFIQKEVDGFKKTRSR